MDTGVNILRLVHELLRLQRDDLVVLRCHETRQNWLTTITTLLRCNHDRPTNDPLRKPAHKFTRLPSTLRLCLVELENISWHPSLVGARTMFTGCVGIIITTGGSHSEGPSGGKDSESGKKTPTNGRETDTDLGKDPSRFQPLNASDNLAVDCSGGCCRSDPSSGGLQGCCNRAFVVDSKTGIATGHLLRKGVPWKFCLGIP